MRGWGLSPAILNATDDNASDADDDDHDASDDDTAADDAAGGDCIDAAKASGSAAEATRMRLDICH